MPENPASFPRREFLTGVFAFGALGALAAVSVPEVPGLLRAATRPLPTWATSSPQTARAYRAALASPQLLAQLPCYCGCMESPTLGHANLRDCYLYADGSLNTHAAGCGICQQEALSASTWQAAGLSVVEIHARIDDTYGGASCTVDRCVE
jgi:Protein of unknown function with PCYCGC motif